MGTNKWQTKAVVGSMGVKVPEAEKLYEGQAPMMQPPFLVKPCNEDNSQGINLVRDPKDVQKALDEAFKFDYELLIEHYIPLGRELRVGVLEMDDGSLEMLPCMEYILDPNKPIRSSSDKLSTDSRGVATALNTKAQRICPA